MANEKFKQIEDVAYLMARTDDPALKAILARVLSQGSTVLSGFYDFTVDAGAIGATDLKDANGNKIIVPAGWIVKYVTAVVQTAGASAGSATLAVGWSGGAAALVAPTAVASLTANAKIDGVPQSTAATMIVNATDRVVQATIATAALTAGKVKVFIELLPNS